MAVLGKDDIESCIDDGDLAVERDDGRSIEPASLDVHLSRKMKYPAKRNNEPVAVDDESTYPEYAEIDTPRPRVAAGDFALATTQETVQIPNGMVALLHGRSSVGRLGLFIENAGLIDPGFGGQITLELTNVEDYDIDLVAGMRIGQLTFHRVENAPLVGYSEHNGNKYDGQRGPTPSRLWEDFE
jgi:dCTP deaminase